MHTVPYSTVLRQAAVLAGLNPDQLQADEASALTARIWQRAREAWNRFWWPEWMAVDRRRFAGELVATDWAPYNFVYWPLSDGYYLPLAWLAGGSNLSLSTVSHVGTVLTLDLYAAHQLSNGDLVMLNHLAAPYTAYNGLVLPVTRIDATQFSVTPVSGSIPGSYALMAQVMPTNLAGVLQSKYWIEAVSEPSGAALAAGQVLAVGDVRQDTVTGKVQVCLVAHTAAAATVDADGGLPNWGELLSFERRVPYEQLSPGRVNLNLPLGTVKAVYALDPDQTRHPPRLPHWLDNTGLLVGGTATQFYVEHRLRCPTWQGSVWSATATYAVGAIVYFSSGGTGDWYQCVTATTAGQSPVTLPAAWSVLSFPEALVAPVAQMAAADYRKPDLDLITYQGELKDFYRGLAVELDRIERQQGQTTQLRVTQRTRP